MRFRISAWGIRNPIPVAILFIALTFLGALAFQAMPIKQFPNIELPAVTVTVTQSGAAPAEVENQITRPVENAVAGISHIKHINSSVALGASLTTIEFQLGADLQKATDDVRTAVERVRVNLPNGIDPPTVQRVDISSAPILTYSVRSASLSPAALSWFVDDTVARTLQASPGVAQVVRIGGVDREINVILDPDRMAALGVTAPQVNEALRGFNIDETGGRGSIGGQEQIIRILGEAQTVEAVRALSIPVAGRTVTLSDVADVGDGAAEERGFARLDGRPAIAFQVEKTREASDVSTEAAVTQAVAKLQGAHPEATIQLVVSTVEDTRHSYDATLHVLIEGMALAALVVFLFLRNWRATAIAAAAMPLSLIPTFWVMSLLGFSLNIITLLALTLVIGILVDDAIVEIENIEKRIERGQSPYRASLIGADAIGLAVVATTASIVAVFTPVSFMRGIIGQFFKEFGLTVAVAVVFSLIVARLLTPLMAAYLLKPAADPKPEPRLGRRYRRLLDWALDHRVVAMAIGGAVFVGALALFGTMPFGFQPTDNAGYFYISLEGPPGADARTMDVAVGRITALLERRPDVARVFAQVGGGAVSGFADSAADLRNGTITVVLRPDRAHSSNDFRALIRPDLRAVPDVRANALGGFGAPDVDIVLSSEDGPLLERTQAELQRQMRGLRELSDVRLSPPPPGPELVVRPKTDEAARVNVSADAIANVMRVATIGDIDPLVAKFSDGERRIPIRVRLAQAARSDLTTLGSLQVPTMDGKLTTLASVADIGFQAGPGEIIRYDRERRASVQADRAGGASLGQAIAAVNALPIMRHLPRGVHPSRIGDAENLNELIAGFLGAIGSAILLMFGVLVLLFRSFFKPAIILAALPLILVGVVIALKLLGLEVDLPVFIGVLMLLGIAAKNSILLVEFAIEDERSGQTRRDALMNACRERARPIVMTTVAMAAGMLPTAIGVGQGSSFRQPMAVAVIGGLISSTALSLVLVPVVYDVVDAFERWITPRFARLVTPRAPGDEAPIADGEETLATEGA